jgi:excisionase family DNA binding protein
MATKKMKSPSSVVMTVDEAAKLLGISRASCYAAVARGEIPRIRIGRRWLIPRARLFSLLGGEE